MNPVPLQSITQVLRCHAWIDDTLREQPSTLGPDFSTHETDIDDNAIEKDDAELLWQWWQRRTASGDERHNSGQRFGRMIAPVLALAGALAGISVTSVALTYTGHHPVNLFVLLGLLVALPMATLLLTGILRGVQKISRSGTNSPAVLALLWLKRIDPQLAEYLDTHLWRYSNLLYWSVQRSLQHFSLAYLLAALSTFLLILTFSDIAFGWSSTLDLSPQTIFVSTEWLSMPWQSWLPIAHPSLELVTESRFFRMQPDNEPQQLTQWWPFVAMCIVVWGILPRLAMWLWCRRRVRLGLRQALLNHPDVNPLVETLRGRGIEYRSSIQTDEVQADAAKLPLDTHDDTAANSISWNHAIEGPWQVRAGDNDTTLAQLFAKLPSAAATISVTVKGWEPPLLEFNDFLKRLRTHLGTDIPIRIEALPLPDGALQQTQIDAWRSTVAKLKDPQIFLRPPR